MDNYPWGTSSKNIIYDYADPTSALTVDVKSIDNAWLKSYAYSNQATLDDLISVVIEKTCTNIAANTFVGCASLLSIYFKDRDGFEVIDMDNWPWGISPDYIYPKPDYSKMQLVLAPRSKKQDVLLSTDIIRRFYSNAAILDLTKATAIDEDTVLAALRQRGINDKNGAKIAPFLSGQTEIGENAFSNTILMRQVRNFKDAEYSALDVSSLADYAFANVSVMADQSCLVLDGELCNIAPTALSNANALSVLLNRSSALPIVTLSSYPFGLSSDANLYYKDEDDCIIARSEIVKQLILSKPYKVCVLTKAVKIIDKFAFSDNSISCVIAAYPIESISSYAFYNTNIIVNKPLSIENTLPEYAFYGYNGSDLSVCTELVDQYAFCFCYTLSSLYLPETTQLSSNAIYQCNDNMILTIDKVEELKDRFVNGRLKVLHAKNAKNITGSQMNYYSTLEELHIDNEVQSNIGNGYGNDHQAVVEVNVR